MSAFLALWNDLERGREAEYDEWHTREHVPERVSSPGFRSGRRYVDREHPVHRYFTLYEVKGVGCFRTPQYLDLLENPTPWSASMRPSFRNFLRVPCALEYAAGYGMGGAVAVLRVTLAGAGAGAEAARELARMPGAVAVRLGRHVGGTPTVSWSGTAPDAGATRPFDGVLVAEALDRSAAKDLLAAARSAFGVKGTPEESGGTYDLAFVFPGADAAERHVHRRPGWSALPASG